MESESTQTLLDSKVPYTIKVQKRSKEIYKIIHVIDPTDFHCMDKKFKYYLEYLFVFNIKKNEFRFWTISGWEVLQLV